MALLLIARATMRALTRGGLKLRQPAKTGLLQRSASEEPTAGAWPVVPATSGQSRVSGFGERFLAMREGPSSDIRAL